MVLCYHIYEYYKYTAAHFVTFNDACYMYAIATTRQL